MAGSIVLQGTNITQATPRQLAACGVAHIPEDRHKHGMVEGYTIADNLVLNTYHQHSRLLTGWSGMPLPSPPTRPTSCRPLTYALRPCSAGGHSLWREPAEDGHRAECSRPLTLLIAAQPTRGLDIGATAFVHQHLVQQRDQGCAVLLVSADLDEILTLADRIAVMYDGKLLAIVATREASRETLGQLMMVCLSPRERNGLFRYPLTSVRAASLLRHALPGLPAFFCQPYAVYIRPSGRANAHTVFCTPHRHREGGR